MLLVVVFVISLFSTVPPSGHATTGPDTKLAIVIHGGAGTILGPVVGTALVILVREELSNVWEHYQILVGLIVILTVIFAPRGLMGLWDNMLTSLDARRGGVATPVPEKTRKSNQKRKPKPRRKTVRSEVRT